MNPVVLIAMYGRHDLMKINLDLLSKQECKVVVVTSTYNDANFIDNLEHNNVLRKHYENYPLGEKWQFGVRICEQIGANPLIILGSDDFLSCFFIKKSCVLAQNNDFIYFTKWHIFDQITQKSYFLSYKNDFPLGSGRIFSANFLKRKQWKLFDKDKNIHLDDYAYESLNHSDIILKNPQGLNLLAIKGNHPTINSLENILSADSIKWKSCNDIDSYFNFEKPIKQIFSCAV